jgi:lipoic acid synthetase
MVGLGETRAEVLDLLERLSDAAVDVVTIGQYLRPSRENLPVEEYVPPAVFDEYRRAGEAMGFRHVFSGPFVRSSYRAEEALLAAQSRSCHSEGRSDEESLRRIERDPSLRSG